MKAVLNVLDDADGPLAWFLGWAMILAILAGFILGMAALLHGPDDMQACIAKGGTWTHTLAQPEGEHTYDHYSDACTLPRR